MVLPSNPSSKRPSNRPPNAAPSPSPNPAFNPAANSAVNSALEPARFQAAGARFVAFFRELAGTFMEREDVLMQIALALLCREHVLLTGPPGTAKSLLASSVLGRLIDEETGVPSLFARQFTESTVQTDLVGPINFKTLTETGRTEHFTDEGILGAAHAFLDEVFDGRDMLLRSTLNLLHERELKQGTRITRGRFECALMASNRYIADVIESSRETLLAFVDRIAFVGFVPRGFADPQNLSAVIRGQVGGAGRRPLEAPLTIQDLDALQAAVDSVYISDPICEGLAALLELLDAELHAAERADPSFIPTRYLSTRTAVRSGRILRAICVYEKMFHEPDRPLEVLPKDLMGLRLHMLLSGPAPHAVAALIEREVDPRERRQLSILRTEREIFDRCWAKLPPIKVTPRPVEAPRSFLRADAPPSASPPSDAAGPPLDAPPAAGSPAGAPPAVAPPAAAPSPASTSPADPILASAAFALENGEINRILDAMRELVPISHGGGPDASRAAVMLKKAAAALHAHAIRTHLASAGGGSSDGAADKDGARLLDVVSELAGFADTLEGGSGSMRPLARWLRARALALIGDATGYSFGVSASELEAATAAGSAGSPMGRAALRVEKLEEIAVQRRLLLAKGADAAGRDDADEAWARGVSAAEDDVVLLCDAALRESASARLAAIDLTRGDFARVLAQLAPDFERVELLDQRLEALRQGPSTLKARALGPRLGLVIAASFARLDALDRAAFGAQVDVMLGVLRRSRLSGVISPVEWITRTAEVLVRSDKGAAEASLAYALREPSYDGYRGIRAASERVPSAFVLAEVALRVAPELAASGATPGEGLEAVAALLAQVPEPIRGRAVSLDVERILRAVTYLEHWWDRLAHATPPDASLADAHLKELVKSRFFDVLLDESALVRFVLETRLVAELFPDRAGEVGVIRSRVDTLQERARQRVLDLVRVRADAAWASALGGAPPDEGWPDPAKNAS